MPGAYPATKPSTNFGFRNTPWHVTNTHCGPLPELLSEPAAFCDSAFGDFPARAVRLLRLRFLRLRYLRLRYLRLRRLRLRPPPRPKQLQPQRWGGASPSFSAFSPHRPPPPPPPQMPNSWASRRSPFLWAPLREKCGIVLAYQARLGLHSGAQQTRPESRQPAS